MRSRALHAVPAAVLCPLLLTACGSDANAGSEVGDGPAVLRVADVGFATPESVLHDAGADVYLVSNINGPPLEKDDNGFISRVSPDGEVLELKWIDGAREDVALDAPKGMAIRGDSLYVADIDCVRIFHRTTGSVAGEVCVDGATFLNDVAVDRNGTVYVTDTGMRAGAGGFEPSGSDAVYQLTSGGSARALARGRALGNPNGIAFGSSGGFVVTFGTGEIYQLRPNGQRETVLPAAEGRQLDGIVFTPGGGFLFSSWGESAVIRVDAEGRVTRVAENVEAPADIGFDGTRNRVLIPLFNANAVLIQQLGNGTGR